MDLTQTFAFFAKKLANLIKSSDGHIYDHHSIIPTTYI